MSEFVLIARQVKQRVTVDEAASWYGYDYKHYRRNECPRCSDASRSKQTLALYESGVRWYCFHCADGGDVIDWLAVQMHRGKGEVIQYLAARFGLSGNLSALVQYLKDKLEPSILADDAENMRAAREIRQRFYAFQSKSTLLADKDYLTAVHHYLRIEQLARQSWGKKAVAVVTMWQDGLPNHPAMGQLDRIHWQERIYLNKLTAAYAEHVPAMARRRFGARACNHYQIGSAPRGGGFNCHAQRPQLLGLVSAKGHAYVSGRMTFPIRDLIGDTIAFGARRLREDDGPKYLNTADSPLFEKRCTLYGLYEAAPYILKRGYAVVVEGYGGTVALARHGIRNVVAPMGTALTEQQADVLARLTRCVVTVYDGDDAGRRAQRRADMALRLARVRAGHVDLPDGLDPEDAIGQHGARWMVQAIREARPVPTGHGPDPLGLARFRAAVAAG